MSTTLTITEGLREEAQELTSQLPPDEHLHVEVVVSEAAEAHTVRLPPALSDFLRRTLETVAAGGRVTFASMPEVVSTTVAAEMLGISRPTLMKLIDDGQLKSHKVGTHTRLKSADVADFRRERSRKQRAAFNEMRAIEAELELRD